MDTLIFIATEEYWTIGTIDELCRCDSCECSFSDPSTLQVDVLNGTFVLFYCVLNKVAEELFVWYF